jgi:hypothetical protein
MQNIALLEHIQSEFRTRTALPLAIRSVDDETWFVIDQVDTLRPFFMSIVSDSNHWLFISSNGGLTAGRKNSQYALFPYATDDKITEAAETTGCKTVIRAEVDGRRVLWEPFSIRCHSQADIRRNLYKNRFGNKIRFEEIHEELGLVFSYEWNSSARYGFVRRARLENRSDRAIRLALIDGLQNVMPSGIEPALQTQASNLADAYKRNECLEDVRLGIYALSAIIVDRAEPSEALKANVAWSAGLTDPVVLLSSIQIDAFRNGSKVTPETDVKGEKGAYLLHAHLQLEPGDSDTWHIIADVNQTQSQVVALRQAIQSERNLLVKVQDDIDAGTRRLRELVAAADGLRLTADPLKDARHYSNTLFNIMRGGIFDHHHTIEKGDLRGYLRKANRLVAQRHADFIEALPDTFTREELLQSLNGASDPDLYRLCMEYLPLRFSRRHGDPSRPWNQFSINTHNELDGSKILDYQGNWRDIFQNWEALAHAYPAFIDGMVFKFLNASTFDGYNPYRVTKSGFDWETIEPDNPWSYIGYWGDHQVIYLLKLLEFCHSRNQDALPSLLDRDIFVYADVPYRIKPYADISRDPKNTIDFDHQADRAVRNRMDDLGADGALLRSADGGIQRATLVEKLLAMLLAKLSNFVPEGGIWMNTQRPEWNDANNALVGNGVSMVTLYYVRRFLGFLPRLLAGASADHVSLSVETADFFEQLAGILDAERGLLDGRITDSDRKRVTDALGQAGAAYRSGVYAAGFSGRKADLSLARIQAFIDAARAHVDHAIRANRREDGLYHAYNILDLRADGMGIERLDEMLEGQVAVLSAGILDARGSLGVLEALRGSALYRADQNSYLLYPDKDVPGFLRKNRIPEDAVAATPLLTALLAAGDLRIIQRDADGVCHFNGNFRNANDLAAALDALDGTEFADLARTERKRVLDIYEAVFNHKAFTGRSGTFFAYEGLGSIYWHMVSKLHLAAQDACLAAMDAEDDTAIIKGLLARYRDIGEGIGIHKDPANYGAFPTDPYSHTPKHKGAQQPGMTGQVKEDILVSIGETGVELDRGRLVFRPRLLPDADYLAEPARFETPGVTGGLRAMDVPAGAMAFTYCQVPVVLHRQGGPRLEIVLADGRMDRTEGTALDEATTREILGRTGAVAEVRVWQ